MRKAELTILVATGTPVGKAVGKQVPPSMRTCMTEGASMQGGRPGAGLGSQDKL